MVRHLCLAVVLVPGALGASEVEFIPSLDLSYFSGDTWYEIKGSSASGDWRSRLTFPIHNIRLGGEMTFRVDSDLEFTLGGWRTLDEEAGTLRDDDYLNGIRDVWSRSDADLVAWGLEGSFTYWGIRGEKVRFGPMLSVCYDRLDYDVYDVMQWGINPVDVIRVDGKVLTYRQERISAPFGVRLKWRPREWFQLEWKGAASFFTYVWDEDDHLLRSKLSKSEGLAFAFPTSLALEFVLADRVRLGAWGEFFFLRTWTARQDQHFYAGEHAGDSYDGLDTTIMRWNYAAGVRLTVEL